MAQRKLRSDTVAEQRKLRSDTTTKASAGPPTFADPEPRAKKPKTTQPRYLCTCCDTEMLGRKFPNFNPTPDCQHLINSCKACLEQWIEVQVESSNFVRVLEDGGTSTFGIKCVECKETMRPVNVEAGASPQVYEKFDRLARRHVAEAIPNWRWCMSADCEHGQEHVDEVVRESKKTSKGTGRKSKAETAELVNDNRDNICTCNKCGARACVNCDVPMHEAETCEEYRQRTRTEENDASLQLIEASFKKCPTCNKSIEKNGGCNYMHCTQCGTAFCWACTQAFQDGSYCACHPRPPGPPLAAGPAVAAGPPFAQNVLTGPGWAAEEVLW